MCNLPIDILVILRDNRIMKQKLIFILFYIILLNVIYSQEDRNIIFSEDEIEIINEVLDYIILNIPDNEILVLNQNLRGNSLITYFKEVNYFDEELINDYINKNSTNSDFIDNSNIFSVTYDQFMVEKDFNNIFRHQIMEEENTLNELRTFIDDIENNRLIDYEELAKKRQEYFEIRLRVKRTYITVSSIGFNTARNEALISFFSSSTYRSNFHFILLIKENNKWIINRKFGIF